MADPLLIPDGVRISSSVRGISIHHKGDVVLNGPIDSRIAAITSTRGSITLKGEQQVDEIRAERGSIFLDGEMRLGKVVSGSGNVTMHGQIRADEVEASSGSVVLSGEHRIKTIRAAEDLQVSGSLRGTSIKGRDVVLNADQLEVGAVEGTLRVDLGECTYKVEIVIAPQVTVHGNSTGRINVIESNNELGPNKLKGRFRLAEYAEFTGIDPKTFLNERDIRALERRAPEVVEPEALQILGDVSHGPL